MKLIGYLKAALTSGLLTDSRWNGGIRSYPAAERQYTAPGYPCAVRLAGQV